MIHYGCMGLPQELVDDIIDMLRDDFATLKACSLTCKAMFASTRHLIHRTLYLTPQNNENVLTRGEKKGLCKQWGYHGHELWFLSHVGERGILRYARHVYVRVPQTFAPDNLIPYLHRFQSLDQAHTVTIERFDASLWELHYKSFFVHFYPALTSLSLLCPLGHYRSVLQFALQFPNLDNLSIEGLKGEWSPPGWTAPTIDQFPPLRGRLRLASVENALRWPVDFANDIRDKVNFRSIELEAEIFGGNAQRVLNACAGVVEDLILEPRESTAGTCRFSSPRWPWRDDKLTFLLKSTVCCVLSNSQSSMSSAD
jgi:hypothetical protein